jgi:hypothetical protein
MWGTSGWSPVGDTIVTVFAFFVGHRDTSATWIIAEQDSWFTLDGIPLDRLFDEWAVMFPNVPEAAVNREERHSVSCFCRPRQYTLRKFAASDSYTTQREPLDEQCPADHSGDHIASNCRAAQERSGKRSRDQYRTLSAFLYSWPCARLMDRDEINVKVSLVQPP